MKKRTFLRLLAAALTVVLTAEPAMITPALANEPVEESLSSETATFGNLSWDFTQGVLTISGTGAMEQFSDPTDRPWHANAASVTQITIENGVTSISDYAFYMCQNAQVVRMPASIKSIGSKAFNGCKTLTQITIPASCTSIGEGAFRLCTGLQSFYSNSPNFKSDNFYALYTKDGSELVAYPAGERSSYYTVADGTKKIRPYAFENAAALAEVGLPQSLEDIGEDAFRGTAYLNNLAGNDGLAIAGGIVLDGTNAEGDIVLGDGIIGIAAGAFANSDTDELTSITILNPECKIKISVKEGVETIPEDITIKGYVNSTADSFADAYGNTFESIGTYITKINESIASPQAGGKKSAYTFDIDDFSDISASDITVSPDDAVFKDDTAYTVSVKLTPSEGNIVSDKVTAKINNKDANLSKNNDGSYQLTFDTEKTKAAETLIDYKISHKMQDVDMTSFYEESSESKKAKAGTLVVASPKTFTGFHADESASGVVALDGSTVIEQKYLRDQYTITYVVPDGTSNPNQSVTKYVYGKDEITFKDATKEGSTFKGWFTDSAYKTQIKSIGTSDTGNKTLYAKFEAGSENGGNGTGSDNYGLTDQQIQDLIKALNAGSKASLTINGVKYILVKNPDGSISISLGDLGNTEKVIIPDQVVIAGKVYPITDIAPGAFKGNLVIREVVIGNNVATIGDSAFEGCKNLSSVTLGEKVVKISDRAFKDTGITSLKTPASLQTIGVSAFENCTKLKTVILNEGLLKIGKKAFYKCSALEKIVIPASVIQIDAYAFAECKLLKKVTFELDSRLLKLGKGVFMNDVALLSIKLPGRLTNIPEKAFYGCKKLSKVTGGEKVTAIGKQAFMNCVKIKSFKVNAKVQKIGAKAFYGCKKLSKVNVKSKALTFVGSKAFAKTNKGIKFTVPKTKKDSYVQLFKGKY